MQQLVLMEITGKQRYIFSSNRLKENVGASAIIRKLTEEINEEECRRSGGSMLQKGGGKSLVLFESKEAAKDFVKHYSRKVLVDFPGVELVVATIPYNKAAMAIWDVIENIYQKLEQKKMRRSHGVQQLSFGIETPCQSTGKPAVTFAHMGKGGKVPLSAETESKRKAAEESERQEGFAALLPQGVSYSNEVDQLYKKEADNGKSYIGVVHLDGNRMGEKIHLIKAHFQQQQGTIEQLNEAYLKAMSAFSEEVDQAYQQSFQEMALEIDRNRKVLVEDTQIDKGFFPIRPLIIAGDDVSYVCNGKIAIESARLFLKFLSQKKVTVGERQIPLTACAGAAIVKGHYPFYKAYMFAEDLCQNAKYEMMQLKGEESCLLDWHIEQGEISGSVRAIRQKHYQADDGSGLTMRPLYLDPTKSWRNYRHFSRAFANITRKDTPRSKIKQLREVFRKGQAASETYLRANDLQAKTITLLDVTDARGENGFHEEAGICLYYDAIECMDLMISLEV